MNDDELSRSLRDEVPAPGPDYWAEIDRRLAAASETAASETAASETAAGDEASVPGAMVSGVTGDTQLGGVEPETGATVVRLRDMTDQHAPRTITQPLTLLAAAAALVIVVGIGFVVVRNLDDDDSASIAADGGTTDSTIDADPDDGAVEDPSGDVDDDALTDGPDPDDATADGPSGDGPVDDLTLDPPAVRLCYAGGELGEGVTAFVDLSGPLAELPAVTIRVRVVLNGQEFYEIVEGDITDADGTVTGQYRNLTEGITVPTQFVAVQPGGLALADDVFVEPVDCAEIEDEIPAIAAAIAELDGEGSSGEGSGEPADGGDDTADGPGAGSGDGEVTFLADELPEVWMVTGISPVDARVAPGLGAEVYGTFLPGDTHLADTGRRAEVDGIVWVELAEFQGRPPVWIDADSLALAVPGRVCYATGLDDGTTPTEVLALDFSADAETFTGAIFDVSAGTFDPEVFVPVAGRRTTGTRFTVNVDTGSGDPVIEEWFAVAEGMSAADRDLYPAVRCAEIVEWQAAIDDFVTEFPALP